MTIKIEKGVPLPSEPARRDPYPFDQMEIGDSFFVACTPGNRSVAVQASKFSKKSGRTFTVRRVEGGVRAWRLT